MQGATIDELTLADEPARWQELGFTVSDSEVGLGRVRVALTGGRDGIAGWSVRGLHSDELDGLPTKASDRDVPPDAPVHPNGVRAIDHVVAFSPDLERSIGALEAAGLDLRRVREEPTPAGAPRQAFFRLGEEILEVIQVPDDSLQRVGGRGAPARFWGLALITEDLERTVARMSPHAGEIRPAVQAGRRIATLRRSAGLSLAVALMSADDAA